MPAMPAPIIATFFSAACYLPSTFPSRRSFHARVATILSFTIPAFREPAAEQYCSHHRCCPFSKDRRNPDSCFTPKQRKTTSPATVNTKTRHTAITKDLVAFSRAVKNTDSATPTGKNSIDQLTIADTRNVNLLQLYLTENRYITYFLMPVVMDL
jgi:hypothetical protein